MEYVRTASFEYATGDSSRLHIENRSGSIVVEGRDGEGVAVQVVAHLWEDGAEAADETMDHIIRQFRQDGDMVRLEVPSLRSAGPWFLFGRGPRVDLHVSAPCHTRARIASRSGRVEVAGIKGPLEIEQRSGRTAVRQVSGDVRVSSRSGACDLEDIGDDAYVSCLTGKISVRGVGDALTVDSRTGSVQVEGVGGNLDIAARTGRVVAERVSGAARLSTTTGSVTLSDAGGGVRIQATTGAARYRGAVRGNVEILVTTGSIQLEVDPEHPFLIDAETVTGSIASELPPRRQEPAPAGAPQVRLRATTGSIRITRLSRFQ